MSAYAEKLLEEIKRTHDDLVEAENAGNRGLVMSLKSTLKELQKRLGVASEALTEGKHLLKG